MSTPATPDPSPPTIDAAGDELAAELAALAGGDRPSISQLGRLVGLAGRSGRAAGAKAVASGRWASEVAIDAAGHLPIRDLDTLQEHFDGLSGPRLAEQLVRSASLAAGAAGAAAGSFAAASEATPATWSALPMELLVETLVVVAIEMKLVAELHAVAGLPFTGPLRTRGLLIAQSWAERRGIAASLAGARGAADLLGMTTRAQLASQIRKRVTRKAGRNVATLAPFLAGAAAGAVLNRRATRALGHDVATSLGLHHPGWFLHTPRTPVGLPPPPPERVLPAPAPPPPPPPPPPAPAR